MLPTIFYAHVRYNIFPEHLISLHGVNQIFDFVEQFEIVHSFAQLCPQMDG